MKNSILIMAMMLIVYVQNIDAQNQRLMSLGGLSVAVPDQDNSLNLFDFGNNPAWLYLDETQSWLKITPRFKGTNGDYKRQYDFESENLYNLNFTGVKTLGTKGTFLGYTEYNVDDRYNVNRSLKMDTYAGEAFFMTDTTSGNFRYDGPTVGFMYSFELLRNLYLGASIDYQILRGLKSTYSRAQTLYRGVGGNAGVAYKISEKLVFGINVKLFDTQESIEAKSDEGTDVEIFNYRGETYSIKDRASASTEKIRKKGLSFGTQLYVNPLSNLEFALKADYTEYATTILLSKPQIKEYEDGFADFETYSVNFKSRYEVIPKFFIGLSLLHSNNDSWSKNTVKDLLIWKWNIKESSFGLGSSYYITSLGLLIGAEYQINSISADSSKYIDGKFNEISSNGNLLKIGSELNLTQKMVLRAGFNYGADECDLICGGEDVNSNLASFGMGYTLNEKALINLSLTYGNRTANKLKNISRNNLAMQAEVKLLSF